MDQLICDTSVTVRVLPMTACMLVAFFPSEIIFTVLSVPIVLICGIFQDINVGKAGGSCHLSLAHGPQALGTSPYSDVIDLCHIRPILKLLCCRAACETVLLLQ